jgi:cell wall-associated NlpC family hydrolase
MRTLADFVGIPFEARGTPPASADCWSLARDYANGVLGLSWPTYMYDPTCYMADARRIITAHLIEPGACWEKVTTPRHGDLLLFRLKGFPVHCAVYLDKGNMLHTLRGRNSTVEPLENWRENLVMIYRWKGTP